MLAMGLLFVNGFICMIELNIFFALSLHDVKKSTAVLGKMFTCVLNCISLTS